MKKDGTAGKGRALLRHLAVVLVFVLAAALVFTPIWVLGGRYAVSAVHDVQAKLPRADSDLQLTEQYGLPGYGKSTVVTGYNTTVFRNLAQLKKGDLIDFSTNWGHFSYRVTDHQVLTSDESVDVSVVDKEKLILFCTYPQSPFGNLADQRLYVFCEKASGPAVEVSADD